MLFRYHFLLTVLKSYLILFIVSQTKIVSSKVYTRLAIVSSCYNRFLMMSSSAEHTFVIDKFCVRQFNNPEYTGTQVYYDQNDFEKKVNDEYNSGKCRLVDGYMPYW